MSLLSEYAKKEQLLKQLSEELKALESDQRLQSEIEFKTKLEALMNEYGKKAKDVIELLSPSDSSNASNVSTASRRRKRKLKIYKNPNTGEPALFTRALIERSEGTGCWHCLSGFASSARVAVE